MVLLGLTCAIGWAAPTWSEMVADAEALAPSLTVPTSWERRPGPAVVDLVSPLGAGWLVVGTSQLSARGLPREGRLELWNTRTGAVQWTTPRPSFPGAVWEVLETTPLVVAGRGRGRLLLLGMDVDVGQIRWTVEATHPKLARDGLTAIVWRDDHVEAIGLRDGQTVWKVPTAKPDRLVVDNGRVLVETQSEVVAIESGWGAESWRVPGPWKAAPPTDPSMQLLHQPNAVQALDPYGSPTWNWSPGHPVVDAFSDQGRATVVTREADTDRINIVAEGDVIGTVSLDGRLASALTPLKGIVVATTEDEVVAFSSTDGSIAYRKPLPDGLLPRPRDADEDQLVEYDEKLIVIRPDKGVAGYDASSYTAGRLVFDQPFVAPGTDGRSLAARREAERGTADNTRLRRTHERLAAARWLAEPVQGDLLIRPFRTGRVQGFTLVDLDDGRRADLVTGPVWPGLLDAGLDSMVAALDPRGETFVVADVPPNPRQWHRVPLGTAATPAPTVRGLPVSSLPFDAEPNPFLALDSRPRPGDAAGPDASAPARDESAATVDIDRLFLDNGGPSWSLCVREGIVEASQPKVVEACLRTGIRLQDADENGMHALLLAAERNQRENVRLLLDAGADPNATEPVDARTAFERATDLEVRGLIASRGGRERSRKEKKKAMKALLGLAGLKKPNDGWCFHHSTRGRVDVLEYCLEQRLLVDYVDPGQGHLLHVAADRGWTGHVRRLLDAGVDPNVVDATGVTPRGRLDAIGELDEGQERAAKLIEAAGGL